MGKGTLIEDGKEDDYPAGTIYIAPSTTHHSQPRPTMGKPCCVEHGTADAE